MERPISVWNGAPEVGGICRINAESLAKKLNIPENILREAIADGIECIQATDDRFKEYGCMTFDDIGVIRRWEEALLQQCEKWKQ